MTFTPISRTRTRELLDRHGLAPSRALGQNFLCDQGTVDKIVRLAEIEPGDRVIEIGPGLGALTAGLCRAKAKLTVVETDAYILPALREMVGHHEQAGTLRIIHDDATKLDWSELLGGVPSLVVANLPYNVSTPLVLDLVPAHPELHRWLVMVQRESGERLAAGPGSKIYGIPSVLLAYWGEARIVGSVGPDVFLPRPKVESVLVRIDRFSEPAYDVDFAQYSAVVRKAFGQRRKMLRRSLAGVVEPSQMEEIDIDPTTRPEQIHPAKWADLARVATFDTAERQDIEGENDQNVQGS